MLIPPSDKLTRVIAKRVTETFIIHLKKGSDTMTDKKSFEQVVAELVAIRAEDVKEPSLGVKFIAQEGEFLGARTAKDLKILSAAGLDTALPEKLPVLAGAARWTESEWFRARGTPLAGQ
jgi:hypothetical protein